MTLNQDANDSDAPIPVASTAPVGRPWWVWSIPAAAALFALVLVGMYYVQRGQVVTVVLAQGHGVEVGTSLRCRGVVIGEVEAVRLDGTFTQIEAMVRLKPDAEGIARVGSRFWLVRPRVNVNEISGLETLAGARYLAVIPGTGEGEPQHRFIALDEPPVVEGLARDGLEIQLTTQERGSVQPGTPILYRQIPIGKVLSVGLAGDSASVEVRAYIEPAYALLVRDDTKFWNVSGVGVDVGFGGLKLQVDSLAAVLTGGIAMATPDPPGEPARTGRRFVLHPQVDPDWLDWQPRIAIGAAWLPPGTRRPGMVRVTVSTTSGRIISRTTEHRGWLLPTERGLVGPARLISHEQGVIELLGRRYEIAELELTPAGDLAAFKLPVSSANDASSRETDGGSSDWPAERTRAMSEPEDCVICADPSALPVPLASARLETDGASGGFIIDPSLSLDPTLNGAAIIARSDGYLVGVLSITENEARVLAWGW